MHKQVREFFFVFMLKDEKEENFVPTFTLVYTTTLTKSLNYRVGGMMMGLVGWMVGCCIMNVAGGMRTNDRKCFKQGGKWKGGCLRQGETRRV